MRALHRSYLILATAATVVLASPQAVPNYLDPASQQDSSHADTHLSDVALPSTLSADSFLKLIDNYPELATVEVGGNYTFIDPSWLVKAFVINYTQEPLTFTTTDLSAAWETIANACGGEYVPGTAGLYDQGADVKSGFAFGYMEKDRYNLREWDKSIWASTLETCR
ncbi:hypothetical protein Micbo1qcDRAFT_181000 [Microdochium bolleyi]|uniref:Uncharacterized protein n=1 Tax=Microdochium bolleyi TaxID=196109 RepID=A0A136IJX1_9PEZI|nr:hypothetical protein Micbo1qcDRAFT_181000 [Microdochium bolleyi]